MSNEGIPKCLFLSENSQEIIDKRISNKVIYQQTADGRAEKIYKHKIHNTLQLPQHVQDHLKNQTYIHNICKSHPHLEYSNTYGLLFTSTGTHIDVKSAEELNNLLKTGKISDGSQKIPFSGQLFLSPSQNQLAILSQKQIVICDVLSDYAVLCRFQNGDKQIQTLVWQNDKVIYGWKFFGLVYACETRKDSNLQKLLEVQSCDSVCSINETIVVCSGMSLSFFKDKKMISQVDLGKVQNPDSPYHEFCNTISIIKANNFESKEFKQDDLYLLVVVFYQDPDDDSEPCNKYLNFMKGNLIQGKLQIKKNELFYSSKDDKSSYMNEQNEKYGFQVKSLLCGSFIAIELQRCEIIYAVDLGSSFQQLDLLSLDSTHQIKAQTFLKGFAFMKTPIDTQHKAPEEADSKQRQLFEKYDGKLLNLFFKDKQTECVVQFPPCVLVLSDKQLLRRYAVITSDKVDVDETDNPETKFSSLARKCLLVQPIRINRPLQLSNPQSKQLGSQSIFAKKQGENTPIKQDKKNSKIEPKEEQKKQETSNINNPFETPQSLFQMPFGDSGRLFSNQTNTSIFSSIWKPKNNIFDNADKLNNNNLKEKVEKNKQKVETKNSEDKNPFVSSSFQPIFAGKQVGNAFNIFQSQNKGQQVSKEKEMKIKEKSKQKTPQVEQAIFKPTSIIGNHQTTIFPKANQFSNTKLTTEQQVNFQSQQQKTKGNPVETKSSFSLFGITETPKDDKAEIKQKVEKPEQPNKRSIQAKEDKKPLQDKKPQTIKQEKLEQSKKEQKADVIPPISQLEEVKKIKSSFNSIRKKIETYEQDDRGPEWFTLKRVSDMLEEKDVIQKISGTKPAFLKERIALLSKVINHVSQQHHRRKLTINQNQQRKTYIERICIDIKFVEQMAQKLVYYSKALEAARRQDQPIFIKRDANKLCDKMIRQLSQKVDELFEQAVVIQSEVPQKREAKQVRDQNSSYIEVPQNKSRIAQKSQPSKGVYKFNMDSSSSQESAEENNRQSYLPKKKSQYIQGRSEFKSAQKSKLKDLDSLFKQFCPFSTFSKKTNPKFKLYASNQYQIRRDKKSSLKHSFDQEQQQKTLKNNDVMRESNERNSIRSTFRSKVPQQREGVSQQILKGQKKTEIPIFKEERSKQPKVAVSQEVSQEDEVQPDLLRNHSSVNPKGSIQKEGEKKTQVSEKKPEMLSSFTNKIESEMFSKQSKKDIAIKPLELIPPDSSFMKRTKSKDIITNQEEKKGTSLFNFGTFDNKKQERKPGHMLNKSSGSVVLSSDEQAQTQDKVLDIPINLHPNLANQNQQNDLSQSQNFAFQQPGAVNNNKKKQQNNLSQAQDPTTEENRPKVAFLQSIKKTSKDNEQQQKPTSNIFQNNNSNPTTNNLKSDDLNLDANRGSNPFWSSNSQQKQGNTFFKPDKHVTQEQGQAISSIPGSSAGGYQVTSFGGANKFMAPQSQSQLQPQSQLQSQPHFQPQPQNNSFNPSQRHFQPQPQNNSFNPSQRHFGSGSQDQSSTKSFTNYDSGNPMRFGNNISGSGQQQQVNTNPMAPNSNQMRGGWMNAPQNQSSSLFNSQNNQSSSLFSGFGNPSSNTNVFNIPISGKTMPGIQGNSYVTPPPPPGVGGGMMSTREKDD